MPNHPFFWAFRRCPYAIRARLALLSSGLKVKLREILLRDKPKAFLETSPSGTVPALRMRDQVIYESLDIMIWALKQSDPQCLLDMPQEGGDLIELNDGPFKTALDHTKYDSRYPELETELERQKAAHYLTGLMNSLTRESGCLEIARPLPIWGFCDLLDVSQTFRTVSTSDLPDTPILRSRQIAESPTW